MHHSTLRRGPLRQLEGGSGPGNVLLLDSALPQARIILGLERWVVGHARPDGLHGYTVLTPRTAPKRLTFR